MRSNLKVVYIPREDYRQASGGDYFHFCQIIKHIRPLGVDIEVVPVDELSEHKGADFLHLSQIYQLDTVEFATKWAAEKGMPFLISPLFEEMLPLQYRRAVVSQWKWQSLRAMVGTRLGEPIYTRWQMARRSSSEMWQRQRRVLVKAHIVTNTEYERDHVISYFDLDKKNTSIVRLGIDTNVYGAWTADGGEKLPAAIRDLAGAYILQVGVLSERKNQIGLIEALADTDFPIVFRGRKSPYEEDYYYRLVDVADKRGNVFILDWVSEDALASLYGNALAHILPSWSERPGMVTLEAAACGCRVISSNRAPIHEYLGNRAWYIDPSDLHGIRSTVEQAVASMPAADMREYILKNFGWENSASQLKRVYLELTG